MARGKRILFLGPISSGKDTQSVLLVKKYHLPMISMGNLLREQIARKTLLGKKVSPYLKSGSLVPDNLVLAIVKNRFRKKDCAKGFILDGFPRDLVQAEFFKKITELNYVFELKLKDKEVFRRIGGRRVCLCGMTYHLEFNPPKKKDICDRCGKKLFIRSDDKVRVVKKRLEVYKKTIKPLIYFYQKQKIYYVINGNQSIEKIHQDIVNHIK